MIWYLRQLFPTRFKSRYTDATGKQHRTTWWMWFGRCFWIAPIGE